jgi:protein-S-isoprenylcysteine O-methyltransferase Ste14
MWEELDRGASDRCGRPTGLPIVMALGRACAYRGGMTMPGSITDSFGPDPLEIGVGLLVFSVAVISDAAVGRRGALTTPRADRGTYWTIVTGQALAVILGLIARIAAPWADLPAWASAAGIVAMVVGMALRLWAVRALGDQFRRVVAVTPDQPLVTSGPYRWVRHPSYTGALLIFGGFGLALANALSLVVLVVLPGLAYLRRIRVEEEELETVLGERYLTYARGRARLVPSVW